MLGSGTQNGATPLRTSSTLRPSKPSGIMQPSSRPLPSMIHAPSSSVATSPATSNLVPKGLDPAYHHQLSDLVNRNQESQSTIKTLESKLTTEATHFQELLGAVRTQHQEQATNFESALSKLHQHFRIALTETKLEKLKEQGKVLKEMEENRKEQLQTLRRDFRIVCWQMKETEMEGKVEELEEEKERVERSAQDEVVSWQMMADEAQAMLRDKQRQLTELEEERDALSAKVEKWKSKQDDTVAESKNLSGRLERALLQLEGEKTRYDDLQKKHDELRLSNNDLRRQLEKWQHLETKGNNETELLRKQRIELEVKLKEMEDRYERQETEQHTSSDKDRRKLKEAARVVKEWEEAYQQIKADSEASEKEVEKLQRQIARLKSSLEEERSRVKPPSPQKTRAGEPSTVEPTGGEEGGVTEIDNSPIAQSQPIKAARKRPTVKRKPPLPPREADSEIEEIEQPADFQTKRKGKEKAKAVTESEDASEAKSKKPKPRSKAKAIEPEEQHDSDVEEVDPEQIARNGEDKASKPKKPRAKAKPQDSEDAATAPLAKPANKGKRKQGAEESDMEMEDGPPPAKRRANSRAPSDGREVPSISKVKVSAGRSSSAMPSGSSVVERRKLAGERRAASVQRLGEVAEEDEEEAEGGVKKKKMRKINIFGSSDAAASFNFGSQATDNLGLNIPTILSPVKESEAVPSRLGTTGSGSVFGSIFNRLHRRT